MFFLGKFRFLVFKIKKSIRNKVHTRLKMTLHDSLKCVLSNSILARSIPMTES